MEAAVTDSVSTVPPELLRRLEEHWGSSDQDVVHELYHPDAVLEFPQSGERFEGVENFKSWRMQYPASLRFHIRRLTRRDDLVIAELLLSYDGRPWTFTVNLLEFRGDHVERERIYIMDGWEAPDWRQPWRSPASADRPLPAL